jgi:hypothetical protein
MMAYALDKAVKDLASRFGQYTNTNWRYGLLTKVVYTHAPFSNVPILKYLYQHETEYSGNRRTPNMALYFFNRPEDKLQKFSAGAVFRMVNDLSDDGKMEVIMDYGIEQTSIFSQYKMSQNEIWQ